MIYKEYEKKCNEIRMRNEAYLDEFWEDLSNAGLKEKTINRHCQNVDFYINVYLLREEPLEMISGTDSYKVDDFFGNFFIRKCMWSTPGTIKSTAASIKKFYHSMLQRGYIDESNYRELTGIIKSNMDYWLADCEAYNDPEAPNPFYFPDFFE
ncbi:MAG: recombinase [Clostridiaceae bacterium]|nr:recombinase [Clostridiaceae bacterium]